MSDRPIAGMPHIDVAISAWLASAAVTMVTATPSGGACHAAGWGNGSIALSVVHAPTHNNAAAIQERFMRSSLSPRKQTFFSAMSSFKRMMVVVGVASSPPPPYPELHDRTAAGRPTGRGH